MAPTDFGLPELFNEFDSNTLLPKSQQWADL
jgi:hypothetical protein